MREVKQSLSNRSQNLRVEKGKRSQDRVRQAASNARQPNIVSTPPVLSRGKSSGVPIHHRAQGKVRRKYYYSLNTPGAEVRLPAIPIINPGWRLVSGSLVVLLTIALFMLWNSPQFQFETAKVTGIKRIPRQDIITLLNIQGMPVIKATPAEMEKDLILAFPDIERVSVQVGLPAALSITLKEREPVIAWQQEGQISWIDQNGIAFPTRGEPGVELIAVHSEGAPPGIPIKMDEAAAAAPIVEGSASQSDGQTSSLLPVTGEALPFLPEDLIKAIQNISTMAPPGMPLVYHPRYGLGWNDPQGWKVYFGLDLKNMEMKLQQYQVITTQLTSQGIQPRLISVEFIHAPFYRLE